MSTSPFSSRVLPTVERITTLPDTGKSFKIHDLGACVVDLVPPVERRKHLYWRGASLGATAYNLLNHNYLNTPIDPDNPRMHFASGPGGHSYADQVARSVALREGYYDLQYPTSVREFMETREGVSPDTASPAIIFPLDPHYNDYYLRESDRGACEGVVWDGAVTLDMIDRRSRAFFENLIS